MTTSPRPSLSRRARHGRPRQRQRGVVLLFALVVLVILLAGGVAVVRSMNASFSAAGNLAFKRDLVNQGERAVQQTLAAFDKGGALADASARQSSVKAQNYSADMLPTNAHGVPLALLSDAAFNAVGVVGKDIEDQDAQIHVRYVIDRLCNAAGLAGKLGANGCVIPPVSTGTSGGTSSEIGNRLPPPPSYVYRLSIRVTGPRDTQVFTQASFARPD